MMRVGYIFQSLKPLKLQLDWIPIGQFHLNLAYLGWGGGGVEYGLYPLHSEPAYTEDEVAPLHVLHPQTAYLSMGNPSSSSEGLPCLAHNTVCVLSGNKSAHARKLDPVLMTVVMAKQYVYSQHQSMVGTLWLALLQQRISKQLRNFTWPPGSDNQLDCCSCFPLAVYTPQFKHLVWRAISSGFKTIYFLWHPQQGWFWTLICSQILHKYLRSTFLFFPQLTFFPFPRWL